MMTTNTEDEEMRHGTMMCGDPKFWFPMRVTNRGMAACHLWFMINGSWQFMVNG